MALEWGVVNVGVDGIDRTQPANNQGQRDVVNGQFITPTEIIPTPVIGFVSVSNQATNNGYRMADINGTAYKHDGAHFLPLTSSRTQTELNKTTVALTSSRATSLAAPIDKTVPSGIACADTTRGVAFVAQNYSGVLMVTMIDSDTGDVLAQCRPQSDGGSFVYNISTLRGSLTPFSAVTDSTAAITNIETMACTLFTQSKTLLVYFVDSVSTKYVYITFNYDVTATAKKTTATLTYVATKNIEDNTVNNIRAADATQVAGGAVLGYIQDSTGNVILKSWGGNTYTLATASSGGQYPMRLWQHPISGYLYVYYTRATINERVYGAVFTVNSTTGAFTLVTGSSEIVLLSVATGGRCVNIAAGLGYANPSANPYVIINTHISGTETLLTYGYEFTGVTLSSVTFNILGCGVEMTSQAWQLNYLIKDNALQPFQNVFLGQVADLTDNSYFYQCLMVLDYNTVTATVFMRIASVIGQGRLFSRAGGRSAVVGDNSFSSICYYTQEPADTAILPGYYAQQSQPYVSTIFGMSRNAGQTVEVAGTSYTNAGRLMMWSGGILHEAGHLHAPTIISVATSTASGAVPAATYAFKCVFYAESYNGRAIISAPSVEKSGTLGAPGTITLTIKTPAPSYIRTMYVSLFVKDNTTGNYYNVPASALQYLYNDSAYQSVSRTIVLTTNPLNTANAQLYTDIGEIPNALAFACNSFCQANDRVFLGSDLGGIFFSKPQNFTRVIEFSDLNQLSIPTDGTEINLVAGLNNALVAFSDNSIHIQGGSGPDAFGFGTFSGWNQIETNLVASLNAISQTTSKGVWYTSTQGLALLGRDSNTQKIDFKVIPTATDDYQTIPNVDVYTALEVSATENELFVGAGQYIYRYNTLYEKWAKIRYDLVPYSASSYECKSILSSSNALLFGTPTLIAGTGRGVQVIKNSYNTGWVPLFGGQQYGRVRKISVLIGRTSPDDFFPSANVYLYFDYNDSLSQTEAFASLPLAPQTTGTSYALVVRPTVQKIRAIKIVVEFQTQDQESNSGLSLQGFALEAAAKRGVQKLPAAQTR